MPLGAPNYWLKRLIPPFLFGLKHAILFQMCLIPVTMSKSFLAQLAVCCPRLLPYELITQFHIHMGYTMAGGVVVATAVFLGYFGTLCADYRKGAETVNGCEKMTTEIMATGLCIFGLCAVVLASSFFRARLSFEVRIHWTKSLCLFCAFAATPPPPCPCVPSSTRTIEFDCRYG